MRRDCSADGFDVILNIFVCEAQNVPTEFSQSLFSSKISFTNLVVVAAVNLNDELSRFTGEVCDIAGDWVLASEFKAT